MKNEIEKKIIHVIINLQKTGKWPVFDIPTVIIDRPKDRIFGDFTTNSAMVLSRYVKKNPYEIAKEIVIELENIQKAQKEIGIISKIDVISSGYINFFLSQDFFINNIQNILDQKEDYGKNGNRSGKKIMIEYTNPNPFKVFHIGHLMTNIIGETLARLYEMSGASVKRANYQGDVGLHVAKTLWGILKNKENFPVESMTLTEKTEFLGASYAMGHKLYEEDEEVKAEIDIINEKVYTKTDPEINMFYDYGRLWSLEHFEEIYKILGTVFDFYFFESETWKVGKEIVFENVENNIFKKSNGAIIFKGEDYGLHARVFINKNNLTTYEAKDLGLIYIKQKRCDFDKSVVITANEQDEYFKVVIKAVEQINPELSKKMQHIGHGMMRLESGKMSSRKGTVISGEQLFKNAMTLAEEKMPSTKEYSREEKKSIAREVGLAALRYTILKQSIGKDIIYNPEKALSLDGDTGPYLQYTAVRIAAILKKAQTEKIKPCLLNRDGYNGILERKLELFREVVEDAAKNNTPHTICTYLSELAHDFNRFYEKTKIVDHNDKNSPYRLALMKALHITFTNGLRILGIKIPERM